jgi:hypothetical protein
MSARRLAALLLVGLTLAAVGLAARAAAPRSGAPPSSGAPAAVQQTTEPQGGGEPPDTAAVQKKNAYANALPDSAGKNIAERWCVLCHSAMLITQQAKDSTGWEKTITLMEKWGVVITPEEHDTLRTYLLRSFGPRPMPGARASAPRDTVHVPAPPR